MYQRTNGNLTLIENFMRMRENPSGKKQPDQRAEYAAKYFLIERLCISTKKSTTRLEAVKWGIFLGRLRENRLRGTVMRD